MAQPHPDDLLPFPSDVQSQQVHSAPEFPQDEQDDGLAERLTHIEERMERIERMLEHQPEAVARSLMSMMEDA